MDPLWVLARPCNREDGSVEVASALTGLDLDRMGGRMDPLWQVCSLVVGDVAMGRVFLAMTFCKWWLLRCRTIEVRATELF